MAKRPPMTDAEGAPALDEILRHVRYLTGQVEEASKREREPPKEESDAPAPEVPVGAAAEFARALSIQRADFGKWVEMQRRAGRRWVSLALAAGFPAALMLGVLVQLQFEAIPPHDPTGGWRGHVWESYGHRIVDCAVDAKSRDTAGGVSTRRAVAAVDVNPVEGIGERPGGPADASPPGAV